MTLRDLMIAEEMMVCLRRGSSQMRGDSAHPKSASGLPLWSRIPAVGAPRTVSPPPTTSTLATMGYGVQASEKEKIILRYKVRRLYMASNTDVHMS